MKRHLLAHPVWLLLAGCGFGSATAPLDAGDAPQIVGEAPAETFAARRAEAPPHATAPTDNKAKHTAAPRAALAGQPSAEPSSAPQRAKKKNVKRSAALPNGLFNPMPGGVMAGYRGDTGLDIAGNRMPVYAIAAGTLDYSEQGHTLWTGPRDTNHTVRLKLDEPIAWGDQHITHVWYAHLSELTYHQAEGAAERIAIEGGEQLGVSGVANGSPHLHLGLLLDNVVSQHWGSFLLEDDCRVVLGGWQKGQRLPAR